MQVPPGTAQQEALGGVTGGGASYLELPTGLWQRVGGVDHAGEGVIVGVIDTGIVPEDPSFADDPSRGFEGPAYDPPEVWDGVCQGGERFAASACNDKLVGARYFVDGFGEENVAEGAFISPRDDDGHGSHTASTAAGNYGVNPVIDGNELGVGVISGLAPRAYVAAYKGCWAGRVRDGCVVSDLVDAIDAAVADGVDVIDYSIGAGTSNVVGPDSIAFLGASDAGVFVANSAGNTGPGAGTVGSPASVPWLTTVAASTTRQAFEATLTVLGPTPLGHRRDVDGQSACGRRRRPAQAAASAAQRGGDQALADDHRRPRRAARGRHDTRDAVRHRLGRDRPQPGGRPGSTSGRPTTWATWRRSTRRSSRARSRRSNPPTSICLQSRSAPSWVSRPRAGRSAA